MPLLQKAVPRWWQLTPPLKDFRMRIRPTIIFSALVTICSVSHGQDTAKYHSLLANKLLAETIDLYPDSTFKFENIFDLNWSEYGRYSVVGNRLTLKHFLYDFPVSVSLSDSLMSVNRPFRTTVYKIENEKMYQLNESGSKITSKKDKSFRTKWSWLSGHKHDYHFVKSYFKH